MQNKSEIRRRAENARTLKDDPCFREFVQQIRDEAAATFLGAASINESVEAAHLMLRGMAAIEQRLEQAIANHIQQQKKG